jgi:hypothetical protein
VAMSFGFISQAAAMRSFISLSFMGISLLSGRFPGDL